MGWASIGDSTVREEARMFSKLPPAGKINYTYKKIIFEFFLRAFIFFGILTPIIIIVMFPILMIVFFILTLLGFQIGDNLYYLFVPIAIADLYFFISYTRSTILVLKEWAEDIPLWRSMVEKELKKTKK